MVSQCARCRRQFGTPSALASHRNFCTAGLSGLPAVVKRSKAGKEVGCKRGTSEAGFGDSSTEDRRGPTGASAVAHTAEVAQKSGALRVDLGKAHQREVAGVAAEAAGQPSVPSGPSERDVGQLASRESAQAQAASSGQQDAEQEFAELCSPPDDPTSFDPFADICNSPDFQYVKQLSSSLEETVRFVRWARSCNNFRGLPQKDLEGLFELFRAGFHPDKLKVRTAKDVRRFEADHLYLEKDGWRKHILTREGDPYEVVLFYLDSSLAFRRLLSRSCNAPAFAYRAEQEFELATEHRRFSSPATGTWFELAQEFIHQGFCPGAVIAALIFYSDVTTLSNDRRTSGWPLVLTLANIAFELRGRPEGHELLAVLPILKAVPGLPGFEPDSAPFRQRIRETFHESLRIVLQPLKDFSFSGLVGAGPNGLSQTFYPLLYAYVCDHPEGCKATCTKDSNQTPRPCSVCMALASQLNDVNKRHPYRTPELLDALFERTAGASDREREEVFGRDSFHAMRSALEGFNGYRTVWGNWYETVHIDCMHQSDLGLFPMVMDTIIIVAAGSNATRVAKAIESNLMTIRETCRFADLRIPGSDKGGYLTSKSRSKFTAFEQRAVMQVMVFAMIGLVDPKFTICVVGFLDWYMVTCRANQFTESELDEMDRLAQKMMTRILRILGPSQTSNFNTVKVHGVTHFRQCIKRSGVPKHYSSNLYESLHIELLKTGYRASNRRNAIEQVVDHHRKLCAQRELAGLEAIEEAVDEFPAISGRESALIKAIRSQANELAGEKLIARLDWLDFISKRRATSFGVVSKDAIELLEEQPEVALLYHELRAYLGPDFEFIKGSKMKVHTALAVPPRPDPRSTNRALYARATSSFFGQPWFSNVVLRAEAEGKDPIDWYAQARLFLSCVICRPGRKEVLQEMAFVRYYKEQPGTCPVTKCRRFRWETQEGQYRVVSVHNILRLVHLVPNFSNSKQDEFFLNRFLFEHADSKVGAGKK